MPTPKGLCPPADHGQVVRQAVLLAQLLTRLTDNFLSADSATGADETGRELLAAVREAAPVVRRAMTWWAITNPPPAPPAALSHFHWAYRRARSALAHALVAAGGESGRKAGWEDTAAGWGQSLAFARRHVPPVDHGMLDVRLCAEAQAAAPAREPNAVIDEDIDLEIDAWEHWLDEAEAAEPPAQSPAEATVATGSQLADPKECSLRKDGDVWRLRYGTETASYPAKDHKAITWLRKALAKPNHALTVADLFGDPEDKLAADAATGQERVFDREGAAVVRKQIEEIDAIARDTGWTEALEERKARALAQLKGPVGKRLSSAVRRAHHNIATQLRRLRCKLRNDAPALSAHLDTSLKLDFPEVGYFPPDPTPDWQL